MIHVKKNCTFFLKKKGQEKSQQLQLLY